MPKPSSFGWRKLICLLRAKPCLLVGSILELREAMECYMSPSHDNAVFGSAWPSQRNPQPPSWRKTTPESAQPASTNSPVEEAAMKVAEEEAAPIVRPPEEPSTSLDTETRSQPEGNIHQIDSLGGGKWSIPPGWSLLLGRSLQSLEVPNAETLYKSSGGKDGLMPKGRWRVNKFKAQSQNPHCQWRDAGNFQASDMLPPGFLGSNGLLVGRTLCQWKALEAPPDPLQLAAVNGVHCGDNEVPASIVKDEATGVTYMDPVTTSVGQVALSGPNQGTPAKRPSYQGYYQTSHEGLAHDHLWAEGLRCHWAETITCIFVFVIFVLVIHHSSY